MKLRFPLFLVAALLLCRADRTAAATEGRDLVLQGAKVYPSPTAESIDNAAVLIHHGRIVAVGRRGDVKIPSTAQVIDCTGKVIVAGFWNSHVHFETGWQAIDRVPAGQVETDLQSMLTRWGFTTVWDLGSDPSNTLALRQRITSGEIPGPRILMAGDIFPQNGHPVYLPADVQLPEAQNPQQAEQMAQQYMKMGLDGMKLFTGAFHGR
jgi:imidazolonepropionase-like amidohydrolase